MHHEPDHSSVVILLGLALALVLPSRDWPRQASEEQRLRIAAFEHLTTVLFPADTTAALRHCFEVRTEPDIDAPPEGAGRDPGAAVLAGIRRFVPRATAVSECPDAGGAGVAGNAGSPVLYFVGGLTQSGSGMRVPVGYRVSGQHGGGWSCVLGLRDGSWRVVDCLPTWISDWF